MITIWMYSGGGTKREFMTCETKYEACEFCSIYGWKYVDENGFEWELDYDAE